MTAILIDGRVTLYRDKQSHHDRYHVYCDGRHVGFIKRDRGAWTFDGIQFFTSKAAAARAMCERGVEA